MRHYRDLSEINLQKSFVTIGSFDGVHKGHQQIIQDLVKSAKKAELPSGVITFHPHPQLVIHNESRPYYLTMPDQRANILGEMGIDFVLTHPFTSETSQLSAEEFINILWERFRFSELWVGYDFALGKNREGTPQRLRELGKKLSFDIHEIQAYQRDGELVSSSGIRNLIRQGNVASATSQLGRPFEIVGKVIKGASRGKSLGFATSNLDVHPEMVDIKPGVYACWAELPGERYKAVTNVGFRPTFGEGIDSPRIEAHLLNFSRDLYGKNLNLQFMKRLRDERKFNQVSDLIEQVKADIIKAESILEG